MDGFEAPIFGKLVWTGEKDYGVKHQIFHSFLIKEVQGGKGVIKTAITTQ